MRWSIVRPWVASGQWLVEYHKAGKGRTLDLFRPSLQGRQLFWTEARARMSASLWERKGNNLKSERLPPAPKL